MIEDVLHLYRNNLDPFNRPGARLPQDPRHLPKTLKLGTIEHRWYLWAANYYMRGGVDSNEAFVMLSRVYDAHPEYFDPFYVVAELDIEDLRAALVAAGLKWSKNKVPEFWFENARRMINLYDGDPANIFKGITTYDEACARIQNDHRGGGFKGFQKKMVSMVTYFYMEAGFIDPFEFPIPVDIHVMRLTQSNEVVKVYGEWPMTDLLDGSRDDQLLDVIRRFYMWCATEKGYDPIELCSALWMYSRLKCADNVEAVWAIVKVKGEKDDKNRKTIIKRIRPDWQNPATHKQYMRSCGTCVLQQTCRWNFGSAPYYKFGIAYWGDPRKGPPDYIASLLTVKDLVDLHEYNPPPREPKKPVASKDAWLTLIPD